ncbi:hypothetical protein [Tardiphaga sp.]|uniref:hypothetical protein n=1 Tax=Tardiphaga sp. TaxID=1926292 RepID=UPI0025F9CCFC|nr:hypothetical protein [Tardiphaga sp.]
MADLIRNERLKLLANWLNAGSIAVLAGSVIVPVSTYLYSAEQRSSLHDWGIFTICICVGFFLPLLAQAVLGALDDDP